MEIQEGLDGFRKCGGVEAAGHNDNTGLDGQLWVDTPPRYLYKNGSLGGLLPTPGKKSSDQIREGLRFMSRW